MIRIYFVKKANLLQEKRNMKKSSNFIYRIRLNQNGLYFA